MVYKLFKNGTNLIFQRQTTIMSAAGVLMVMSIGSAILGLVRQRMLSGLASTVSDKDMLDAFGVAFTLPDLFYNIFITGALNAAFIPVFADFVAHKNRDGAWKVTNEMVNLTIVVFVMAAILLLFFAEPFAKIIAPGYSPGKLQDVANLTRLMVLSPLLLGVSAFIGGGINVYHRFIIPALAPIFYNIGCIIGIKFFYQFYGIDGLAYGVILGAVFHLAVQLPLAYKLGFSFRPTWGFWTAPVKRISALMVPRTVGLAVDRLEIIVATMLTTVLGTGANFLFTRAFSLVTLPVSFFGVSLAQAAMPTLTLEAAKEEPDAFRQTLLYTFHQILFLTTPVAVLLLVLKLPVTRIVLNLPSWTDTLLVAQVLGFFAVGLMAQAGIHIFVRGLYALQDTISPLYAGSAGVITSVTLSLVFLQLLGVRGIALGFSVGGMVNLLALMYFMHRRIGGFGMANLLAPTSRILASGAIMAFAVYMMFKQLEKYVIQTETTGNLIMLTILVSWFGGTLYLFVAWILGSEEIILFFNLAQKVRSWRAAFVKLPTFEETSTTVTPTDASMGS